jgi:S-DNA-T family DNA segregation ATPase FtsK/SpoIIIE
VATAFLGALGAVLALHLTTARLAKSLRMVWGALAVPARMAVAVARLAGAVPVALAERRPAQAPAGPEPGVLEGEVLHPVQRPATRTAARSARESPAPPAEHPAPAALMPAPPQDADGVPPAGTREDLWPLPPLAFLTPGIGDTEGAPVDNSARMRLIEETLVSFNVNAHVVGAHSGPTVTRFDVQPERGVRVSRVTALQNDLALALAARTIRIQAPVPGQSVIGIEIPNAKTSLVTLREILESEICLRMKSPLKIALGKDVSGSAVVADLARMPHLLIAGATGSGKSVCLNSLISCLLFHNSPERLRLLMVDPKMVELSVFNGVPHLLAPVVTDVTKVTGTLRWALKEMHRRYKLFAEVGARNLARYNELQTEARKQLPFIVLIIDELADLMMVSPEDVEDGICRLAQLARATGMHLVLATQRPSVDVITGLIKANFPARIYLSDREIEELVAFWKAHPNRDVEQIPPAELDPPAREEEQDNDDKLLNEAVRVLREYRRASVSLLQRRLSIGYTRAARLLDVLEDRGIVGPSEDGRSRVVLDYADDGSEATVAADDDPFPPL